jgi:hypothetical protein
MSIRARKCRTIQARIGLMVGLVAMSALPALAYQQGNLSLDTLTRRAAVIVEGNVTAVQSAWNAAQTQIHTTVTLKVSQYHKGDLKQDTLSVKFLGGTVGNMTMAVLGQPSFAVNEQVVLFLRPNFEIRDVPFVGADEGKFTVQIDPATKVEYVQSAHQRATKSAVLETIAQVMRPLTALSK